MNKKIDFLIAVAEKGGVENIINMIAPYMQEKGWDVRIVQLVWEKKEWVNLAVPFYPLLQGKEGHDLEELVDAYLEFTMKEGIPEVVIAAAWPYMCYIAKKVSAIRKKDFKVISWLHAPVERYTDAGFGGYAHLSMADAHLAISSNIANNIEKFCLNPLIFRINNPVKFPKQKKKTKKKGNNHKLVFVGRVAEEKKIEIIIQALAKTKSSWKLQIIGEGSEVIKEKLVNVAKENHVLEKIFWLGWRENPWALCDNVEALVMASEYEGFPLAALEAAANGIPIISTPVDGIIELVVPGVNGYLYPFGDDERLAVILDLMSDSSLPELRSEDCIKAVQKFKEDTVLYDYQIKVREIALHDGWLKKAGAMNINFANEDKISIIIPCCNNEKYIVDCIDSLILQTIDKEKLELIFVDYSSKDRTCEYIMEYEQKYPDLILLVRCDEIEGINSAWNIGMNYASGNYCMFVNADDCIQENMVQLLYEKALVYQCDIVECNYSTIEKEMPDKVEMDGSEIYFSFEEVEMIDYMRKAKTTISVCYKLYKFDFLAEHDLLMQEDKIKCDSNIMDSIIVHLKRYYYIPEKLYYFRQS